MKSRANEKEPLKKKIVAACLQLLKHTRKYARVSNTRKRKCWVKPWLAELFSL